MVIFQGESKYLILLLNKEHRDHGLLHSLSGYPLKLIGPYRRNFISKDYFF